MISILLNPFKYIAGSRSFFAGIAIILLTAIVGYFSKTHFPDLISVKVASQFPLVYYFITGFANWLVFALVLYLFALLASPSSVRLIDVLGTQALARAPYLLAAFLGFSNSIDKFGKYLLYTQLKQGELVDLSTSGVVLAVVLMLLTVLLSIWIVVLMYNAFKVSANLKGTKSTVLFIVAFIISMVITFYLSRFLIINLS